MNITSFAYDYKTTDEILKFEKLDKYPLGIKVIDERFGFPTGFYLITGIAGSSKSFFATWLARQMWDKSGIKTAFFTLEMTERGLRKRILQQWSDLTLTEFNQGQSVKEAVDRLQAGSIAIIELDKKDQNISYMENRIKEASDYGFNFIVFDHMNEITGMNDDRNKNVSDTWATFWAKMAKTYPYMHFIVLCQPNKSSFKQKVLTLDSIKGSNVLAERCDYFLSINRVQKQEDDIFNENRDVILWLDKTRNTDINHIGFKLYFDLTGNYKEG